MNSASNLSAFARFFFQVRRQPDPAGAPVLNTPQQHHPIAGKLVQVEAAPAVAARYLRVGGELGLGGWQLVRRAVQEAAHVHPFVDILAAVASGGAPGAAHTQVDLPPAQVQLFSDLAAGLPAAHHQHRARRQSLRIAVLAECSW